MRDYLNTIMTTLVDSMDRLDVQILENMIDDIVRILKNGKKVVLTGLGKNAPICKKVVGSMLSLGMDSAFLETNSAMHGDIGTIRDGDIILILSKSGETKESIRLLEELKKRDVVIWAITFNPNGTLTRNVEKKLVIEMSDEGDPWNIVPNNSTTLYLIVLQVMTIEVAKRLNITLDDFQKNHPGGGIGVKLNGA